MDIKWDILFQNNCTKAEYAVTGLTDLNVSSVYYFFENVELDFPEGEYSYAIILNLRDDVTYEFSDVLLNTICHTSDGDILLSDLNPECGLMKMGEIKQANIYKKNNKEYYYRKK